MYWIIFSTAFIFAISEIVAYNKGYKKGYKIGQLEERIKNKTK